MLLGQAQKQNMINPVRIEWIDRNDVIGCESL